MVDISSCSLIFHNLELYTRLTISNDLSWPLTPLTLLFIRLALRGLFISLSNFWKYSSLLDTLLDTFTTIHNWGLTYNSAWCLDWDPSQTWLPPCESPQSTDVCLCWPWHSPPHIFTFLRYESTNNIATCCCSSRRWLYFHFLCFSRVSRQWRVANRLVWPLEHRSSTGRVGCWPIHWAATHCSLFHVFTLTEPGKDEI